MTAVVEATTNTFAMVSLLRQVPGLELCVVNPRKMRIIADSVCKTDKIDSMILAEFGHSNLKLPQSFIPDQDHHDLRCQLRLRAALVHMRTELKLRVHSLIHGEGFFSPPKDLYSRNGQQWLAQLELTAAARLRLETMLRSIAYLDAEILQLKKQLHQLYAKAPVWKEDVAILTSMPGIGLITALTILAELGDWRRFDDPAAVSNYAGLTPRLGASNKKAVYGRITKQGPRYLRWVLAEAALVAIRYVPRYQNAYNDIAKRSIGGKPTAGIAIARRMLEDGWIMLRKRQPFKFEIKKTCGPRGRACSPAGLKQSRVPN
jgi:transposase